MQKMALFCMYMIWIFSVYMYIRIVGYTDSKYIIITYNIDIDIRNINYDWYNFNVIYLTIDW